MSAFVCLNVLENSKRIRRETRKRCGNIHPQFALAQHLSYSQLLSSNRVSITRPKNIKMIFEIVLPKYSQFKNDPPYFLDDRGLILKFHCEKSK